jgi:hypothetical protein
MMSAIAHFPHEHFLAKLLSGQQVEQRPDWSAEIVASPG